MAEGPAPIGARVHGGFLYIPGIITALVCVLLMSTSAYAQDPVEGSAPDTRDLSGRLMLYASAASDLASTEFALRTSPCDGLRLKCVSERNPLAPASFQGRLALSASYAIGIDLLAWACARSGHPTMAHRFRMLSAAPKIVWTVNNSLVAFRSIQSGGK